MKLGGKESIETMLASLLGIKRRRLSRDFALAVFFFLATVCVLSYSTIASFITLLSMSTMPQTGFKVSHETEVQTSPSSGSDISSYSYRSESTSKSSSSSTSAAAEDTLNFTLPEEVTFSLAPSDSLWIEHLTDKPRAYIFHNILTADECDYLVDTQDKMKRSTVLGDKGAKSVKHEARTSSNGFISKERSITDETVATMRRVGALLTGIPDINQESPQILRYENGQQYRRHHDLMTRECMADPECPHKKGGNRVLTMLFYLSDVVGGWTHFPKSEGLVNPQRCEEIEYFSSGCEEFPKTNAMVKPVKGDALMFFGMDEQNVLRVEESLHEGCPVLQGEKWSATIWVRQGDRGWDTRHTTPSKKELNGGVVQLSHNKPYYNY
jgi:prolyl 4-hydroxylase